MKPEEAIGILESVEAGTDYCFIDPDARSEALEMAIDALEKQIPKPVRITTSTKRCAVCGRQLSGIGNLHSTRKYCVSCGQAIDWWND